MTYHKKYSIQPIHFPQIKQRFNTITSSSSFSKHKNSLGIFQSELKSRNDSSSYKRKGHRLKTVDVNQYGTLHQLKKQLRDVKQSLGFKIKQYNHRLENRLDQFAFLSNVKRQQPQIIFQPYPMYFPPLYPNMMPQFPDQNQYIKPTSKPPKRIKSAFGLKNFRKAAFAVLFTVRLRKFTKKVINFRKQMFKKLLYQTNQFKEQANQIKKILIDGLKPFLLTLLQKQDVELKFRQNDSQNYKKQKFSNTKKMLELLINCIKKTVDSQQFGQIIRSIYYFCRHGSYACLQKLLSHQELQNMSVSQKHHYLQAERNLEKSQIINFLFMKILIYNALGQSWKIDSQKFSKDKQVLQQNFQLITSIFYEILMDIQDDLIVGSPQCYPLNNYRQIRDAKVYPSQSLTIKPGQFRKNQMISGLLNEKYIKNIYRLDRLFSWQRTQLQEILDKIHSKVCSFHRKLIKPFL